MPLENAEYISELNPAWPEGTDDLNTSDDHHRNTKRAVFQSFPNIDAPVEASAADLNRLANSDTSGVLMPTGAILPYAGAAAPNGYLLCDGAAIPAEFTALIALVGANTPDLRGRFLRGWSTAAAQDPDAPRAPLSTQSDAVGPHSHPIDAHTSGATDTNRLVGSSGQVTSQATTKNSTGPETRPRNTAVAYIIKT